MQDLILYANWVLLVIGGILAIAWIRSYWRAGGHGLLAGRFPAVSPESANTAVVHLIVPLLLYILVSGLLRTQLPPIEPEALPTPGAHLWHLIQTQDMAAKMIAALLMLHFLRTQRLFAEPRPERWSTGRTMLAAVPLTISSTAVSMTLLIVSTLVSAWFVDSQVSHPVLRGLDNSDWGVWGKVQLAIGAIIVAPLFEEFYFRGLLLRAAWFVSRRVWIAVLVSGIAFGLIHSGIPQHMFPLAVFGAILAVIRIKTGSIALCVLVHALFNLRPFVLIWFGGVTVDG